MVNPFPFKALLTPTAVCEDDDLYLIIYVHSAPTYTERRQFIRKTWANPQNVPRMKTRIIFAVGISPGGSFVQAALKLEHAQYGDILQESYRDSYKNLTYKAVSALRYTSPTTAARPGSS